MPIKLGHVSHHTFYSPMFEGTVPAGRRVHNRLARLLAKRILKVLAVVRPEVIARHGLAAVLVYPLEDLLSISHCPPVSSRVVLTLYPAAYPNPGNNDTNFLPNGAAALSLKMTVLSCVKLLTYSDVPHQSFALFLRSQSAGYEPSSRCSSVASQSYRPRRTRDSQTSSQNPKIPPPRGDQILTG
jgi:hypothetical protein